MNAQHTPTPWSVESVRNEGDYGDGGPDCRSGFNSYSAQDASGRVLFDTLNADYRITCVHEDHDEDGTHAWDEPGRLNIEHAVKCVNAHDELVAALTVAREDLGELVQCRHSSDTCNCNEHCRLRDMDAALAMAGA